MALRPCPLQEFLGATGEEALLPVPDKPEITAAFLPGGQAGQNTPHEIIPRLM